MNGMKPKFLQDKILPQSYYATPDPYANPAPTNLNLGEMSRYAQTNGKKMSELTWEEVEKFRVIK